MADVIQIRRDTAANWTSVNPVLHQGEYGRETDTGREKCGNGVTTWNSLLYEDVKSVPVSDASRLLDITGDGVPIFPDGTATYFKNRDWTTTDSWVGINGTVAVSGSVLVGTNTGSPFGMSKTVSISANSLIVLRIKSSLARVITFQLTIGGVDTNITTVSTNANEYTYVSFVAPSAATKITMFYTVSGTGNTMSLEAIYIGTGAYTTPIYSKSCCNRLTNYGLLPVQSPFGLALRASGAQYAECDNPVIGITGTVAVRFKRGSIGNNQTLIDNRNVNNQNGFAIITDASNMIYVIIRDATNVTPYPIATIADTAIYHILIVIWDGSNVVTYLDGVYSTRVQTIAMGTPTSTLKIGTLSSGASNYYNGDIIARYDARLWSAADVASWHNDPRSVDSQQKAVVNVPYSIMTRNAKGQPQLPGLSTYADNTAALAGGLVAGEIYRTSAGSIMVVY